MADHDHAAAHASNLRKAGYHEAADCIEAQQAEIERLRDANMGTWKSAALKAERVVEAARAFRTFADDAYHAKQPARGIINSAPQQALWMAIDELAEAKK